MTVNPLAPAEGADFATDAVYEILIDTDGDARAEIAYRTTFDAVDGSQRATVRRAKGDDARERGVTGEIVVDAAPVSLKGDARVIDAGGQRRFFAGLRGDPFFFDLAGYLNGFAFTGADLFADKNVCAIALEVQREELGGGPIGVWCRILVCSHGKLIQIDRMGRPLVNVALTRGIEKVRFNQSDPDQDLALFVETFAGGLRRLGDHADGRAEPVAGRSSRISSGSIPDRRPATRTAGGSPTTSSTTNSPSSPPAGSPLTGSPPTPISRTGSPISRNRTEARDADHFRRRDCSTFTLKRGFPP